MPLWRKTKKMNHRRVGTFLNSLSTVSSPSLTIQSLSLKLLQSLIRVHTNPTTFSSLSHLLIYIYLHGAADLIFPKAAIFILFDIVIAFTLPIHAFRRAHGLRAYMKLPFPAGDPDCSSYSRVLHLFPESHLEMNDTNQQSQPPRQERKRRRREKPNAAAADDDGKQVKVKGLSEIITSLTLLQDQERDDLDEVEAVNQEEMVRYEENHRERKREMMDYSAEPEELHRASAGGARRRKSKLSGFSSATAMAVASSSGDDNDKPSDEKAAPAAGPQRRLWVRNRSKDWWEQCNSPEFPDEEFEKAFRMRKETFDFICNELSSVVAKENTMLRDAVPVRQRVAVCVWRLATGEPLRLVSKKFGLGISTCHKLVLEVCSAIRNVLMPKFLRWPEEDGLRSFKAEFEAISGIPNVVGSMYTTHIPIIAPKNSVAAYFNRRHTERNQKTSYSITVQGVVNPRGVFTDVCIGYPGSMPDDQVLEKSTLYQRANAGFYNGVWIVGGSGYPLMDWVLVPYTHQHLTWTQHAFNEKIGEIQRIAKDSFARLKSRWGCLQKRTEVKLQDLPVVLGACCVLHNICEMRDGEMDIAIEKFDLFDDEMVPEIGLRSANAMKARDTIAHNLLHHNHAGTSFLS